MRLPKIEPEIKQKTNWWLRVPIIIVLLCVLFVTLLISKVAMAADVSSLAMVFQGSLDGLIVLVDAFVEYLSFLYRMAELILREL